MRRNIIHIVLFLLTVVSTWLTGGPGYSIAIMLILLGHELSHYFMSRKHGIKATLPFFLPFPFSPFGTLGAVIRMQSTVSSRRSLFDTGVAGPLASLFLSIPAIVIGLEHSTVILASQVKEGTIRLGDPLLFSFLQRLVLGPVPDTHDVLLHPIGYAGWVGLFVTALNLLPVGQLDGGHIAYALFGSKSRVIFLMTIAVMAFITLFYNPGWLLLLVLIIVFGFRHPAPLDDQTPLDGKRKLIGGIAFLAFFLSFTVAPFPQFVEEFQELLKQLLHWF
jgi:membrane-associated protease RseP (regulator of RpoE activity)